MEEMLVKMQILERKLRISEQQRRDINQAPNNDLVELENARAILDAKESEIGEKKQVISSLTVELGEVKHDLSTAVAKIDVMGKRIEELVKSEDTLADQLDSMEKEGMDTTRRIRELEEEVLDLSATLAQEKDAFKDLKARYVTDVKDYEAKLTLLNQRLDEMRKVLTKALEEKDALAEEARMKVLAQQRELDRAKLETAAGNQINAILTTSLQSTAASVNQMMVAMDTQEEVVKTAIERNHRGTSYLYGELKRLAVTIQHMIKDNESKIKQVEEKLRDEVKRSEQAHATHAKEVLLLQQGLHAKQEALERAEGNCKELQRERITLQQDLENRELRVAQLKQELAEAKDTAGKFTEEDIAKVREAEKSIWVEKLKLMRGEEEGLRTDLQRLRDQLITTQTELRKTAEGAEKMKSDGQAERLAHIEEVQRKVMAVEQTQFDAEETQQRIFMKWQQTGK